jgi:DNA modification methylase
MESRVIQLTEGAYKNGYLSIRPCGREFFPLDVFGGSSKKVGLGIPIKLQVDGLSDTIETDIPKDKKTGEPRWIFRERAWVKHFFRRNKLTPGNTVVISRINERMYKITPQNGGHHTNVIEEKHLPIFQLQKQLRLFNLSSADNIKLLSEWGTFKDSLKAPIHNWFTYPAGFSYKAVKFALHSHNIKPGATVYDPFMGTGTTNVTAKSIGINSFGVEAHPFVFLIAKTKLNFEISLTKIFSYLTKLERIIISKKKHKAKDLYPRLKRIFPELVLKCYDHSTLYDLLLIRESIKEMGFTEEFFHFFNVALTAVLRQVSSVQTGWPYIAPNKPKNKFSHKDALENFSNQIHKMANDIRITKNMMPKGSSLHRIYNDDSRNTSSYFDDASADFVITSPPYLNNYDYADRTRLEMYFFGMAKNWGDITNQVRTRLMTSATTQISRTDRKYTLSHNIKNNCPKVYAFLKESIRKLSQFRLLKGGKKSYDLMVAGYFNDIYLVLKDVFRILRPSSSALFVLGDSAPYGVHIPTEELIGKLGIGIGFSTYSITQLRTRGEKWRDNPQRHGVKLRESIVTLIKE